MIKPQEDRMVHKSHWYKCQRCGHKLFFGSSANIEIKCSSCGHINRFSDNGIKTRDISVR